MARHLATFGPLLEKYGEKIICKVGLMREAKVKELIDYNIWN